MFPSKSDHVTFGLGNHLLASAARMPLENLNVGAEKAESRIQKEQYLYSAIYVKIKVNKHSKWTLLHKQMINEITVEHSCSNVKYA